MKAYSVYYGLVHVRKVLLLSDDAIGVIISLRRGLLDGYTIYLRVRSSIEG